AGRARSERRSPAARRCRSTSWSQARGESPARVTEKPPRADYTRRRAVPSNTSAARPNYTRRRADPTKLVGGPTQLNPVQVSARATSTIAEAIWSTSSGVQIYGGMAYTRLRNGRSHTPFRRAVAVA